MKSAFILLGLFLTFSSNCIGTSRPAVETFPDTTITKKNAFSDLFLDSAKLADFIVREGVDSEVAQRLKNFYNSRNYQFAWFTKAGLAEYARAFWNLQESHITLSRDSFLINPDLKKRMDKMVQEDTLATYSADEMAQTELALTLSFFKYVHYAYAGKIDPEGLSWHIPRKKVDETELLDSLITRKGQHLETWEPINPQYNLMRTKLRELNELDSAGGWEFIALASNKTLKAGDSSPIISQLKRRFSASSDYQSGDTSGLYNNSFVDAVNKAKRQYGLNQDGIINAAFVQALNVPLKERIRQVLINMERMRWLPQQPAGNYILVNIPDFKLNLFEGPKKIFDIKIIVGKTANKTIIFNGMLKYVVFSPYWNVPPSIVKKEILPSIRRNPNYLRANNMERTGYRDGLPEIRQRPGGDNSLGRVKFLFPNNYNIYLHDTPAKSLFQETKRTFSHGCIRLAEPRKLAEYLLRNQPEWTPDRITEAMHENHETWVILKNPVPVAVTYFTSWVSRDGLLNFREDVYGHDRKMENLLFAADKL